MGRRARLPGRGGGKRGGDARDSDPTAAQARTNGRTGGVPRIPGPLYSAFHHSSQIDVRTRSTAKGLVNLGNTCFFNAVLQCICRAVPLRDAMKRLQKPRPSVRVVPAPRFLPEVAGEGQGPHCLVPIDVALLPAEGDITRLFDDFLSAVHGQ